MQTNKGLICIVDDHDDTRDSIGLILESYGWTTQAYTSARGFLEALDESQLPDALILDLDMSEKNSADIQESVRNLKENIPIIMLTVDTNYLRAKQATDKGATVLQKPVKAQDLISVIESLI